MQKPDSIKKFDMLFWASTVVSVIGLVIGWSSMQEIMAAEMAEVDGALGDGAMQGIVLISFIIGIGINVAIWALISLMRIEFVKWIYIALIAYGLVTMVSGYEDMGGFGMVHIPGVIATILSLLSVWMLFKPDAKEWFAAKRGAD